MRQAIALSALGLGTTSPNPPVGCVLLDAEGDIAGQGYHRRKGEAHAEVNALAAAGKRASGGTAVVTLEPCNHHGVTPPCHQALIDAGISRVVIAVIDPTSRGVGGASRLQEAGLDVEVGCLADEATLVLDPWLKALASQRSQLCWAQLAAPELMMADAEAMADLRALRRSMDVVLRADGTVEDGGLEGLFSGRLTGSPLLLTDPRATAQKLYTAGARRTLLDAGHEVAQQFMNANLLDEMVLYLPVVAPSSTAFMETALASFPAGFTMKTLTRAGDFLRIRAVRLPESDT
nr:bifunctional diaminohydroxyphosphoribosylaminopyrimidine deaminase/5-amino-6-(5-phosphoribosylamino)uracil reductase RibD [Kineosporia rhizophila]